ncbi:unnamed protein product [Rotaria sp. Silwood2]|nr:unnamed protein product [Rotaria sp. Silwood2]
MTRLIICISILSFILIHVHGNKRMFIPTGFLQQAWPKDLDFPIDHSDQSDVSSMPNEEFIDTDRPKRNCLTFALKNQHRSPKWMCW